MFPSIMTQEMLRKLLQGISRTKGEICSKLIINTSELFHWLCSGAFIVNLEHISHLILSLTLNKSVFAGETFCETFIIYLRYHKVARQTF